jgi:hypothetical protein
MRTFDARLVVGRLVMCRPYQRTGQLLVVNLTRGIGLVRLTVSTVLVTLNLSELRPASLEEVSFDERSPISEAGWGR